MASPFTIFRKHSTGAMIVLVILSMLLFTFDSLFSAESPNLWLLGLLLGGAIFGISGIKQGRWLQWGIGGAIFGSVLGFAMPYFTSPTGYSTNFGEIERDEFIRLQEERQIANNVMYGVAEAAMPEGLPEQFRQQYIPQIARLFGFRSQNMEADVLFGRLMREEAEKLGLHSGLNVVSQYLNDSSNNELSNSELIAIRDRLQFQGKKLTDEQLQTIIGKELDAQLAFNLTSPVFTSYPAAPHVYWDHFKRFNVTQSLNLIPLETDAFIDLVGEPSDGQIAELFKQYKDNFRDTPVLGDPGFRQYLRARIAYFELPASQAKTEIAAVTDEDVKKWYDENQTHPLIETTVFEDDDDTEETPAEQGDDSSDQPANDGTQPPAEEQTQTPATTEEETSGSQSTEPEENTSDTPPQLESEPAAESTDTPAEGDCDYQEEDASPAVAEETSSQETTTENTTQESETETTPTASENTDSNAAAESTADQSNTEQLPLVIPDVPAGAESGPDEPQKPKFKKVVKPLDDELKKTIRSRLEDERVNAYIDQKMEAAIEFFQALSLDRATKLFEVQESDAVTGLKEDKRPVEIRKLMLTYDADLLKQMQDYAKTNGLTFSQTPLLDLGEMVETDDYPVAKAYELSDNPTTQSQQQMLGRILFSDLGGDLQIMNSQLFSVARRVRDDPLQDDELSHYVAVLSDYAESYVPSLDDDGIREKVVLTWKRLEARKKLEERAEQLIAQINETMTAAATETEDTEEEKTDDAETDTEGEETEETDESDSDSDAQSLAEIVAEMTVTGKQGDNKLVVRPTATFTWLRTSAAPQMQFQQRPQVTLGTILFSDEKGGVVPGVRNEFMDQIFNGMNQDEFALVPDATKTTYYIVQVINRYPNKDIGMDGLRKEFAEAGQNVFAGNPVLDIMRESLSPPVFDKWRGQVLKQYGLVY